METFLTFGGNIVFYNVTIIDGAKTVIVRLEALFKHTVLHETIDLFHEPSDTLVGQTLVF